MLAQASKKSALLNRGHYARMEAALHWPSVHVYLHVKPDGNVTVHKLRTSNLGVDVSVGTTLSTP